MVLSSFFKSTVHQSDKKNLQSEHIFDMVLDTLYATYLHLYLHSSVPCCLRKLTCIDDMVFLVLYFQLGLFNRKHRLEIGDFS